MAVQDYRNTVGGAPPSGDYDIDLETTFYPTPWTTLSTTHWPDGYTTRGGGPNPLFAVNLHEFGHAIRQSLDGSFGHFLYDAVRFWYARTHSPTDCAGSNRGFAFNEGWAEFWATDWGASPPTAPCLQSNNSEQEGDVAAMLYSLSQCQDAGRAGMVKVLRANPGSIHSMPEFAAAFQAEFPACKTGVIQLRRGKSVAHNSGEEVALTAPERIATVIRRIDEQVIVTAGLQETYDEAQRAAGHFRLGEPVDDGYEDFARIATGPPLLAGLIAQSEQVTEALKADLHILQDHDEDDRGAVLTLPNYEQRSRQLANFDDRIYANVIEAARQALITIEPYEVEDRSGLLVRHARAIRDCVVELEDRRTDGLPPPENIQPPGATFGEMLTATSPL
jgi:hypothetical protein